MDIATTIQDLQKRICDEADEFVKNFIAEPTETDRLLVLHAIESGVIIGLTRMVEEFNRAVKAEEAASQKPDAVKP